MRVGAKILIIDHNDSFTYNLVQLLEEGGVKTVHVIQVAAVRDCELEDYDGVILSPGPGLPTDYPVIFEVLDTCLLGSRKIPVLGICLGLQAIVVHFGGRLYNLPEIRHGRQVWLERGCSCSLFKGLNFPLQVGLYHSWAMDSKFHVPELLITSKCEIQGLSGRPVQSSVSQNAAENKGEDIDSNVGWYNYPDGIDSKYIAMSLRHRTLPVYGLQFHPESFMTPSGGQIMQNWLALLSVENKPHTGELLRQTVSKLI